MNIILKTKKSYLILFVFAVSCKSLAPFENQKKGEFTLNLKELILTKEFELMLDNYIKDFKKRSGYKPRTITIESHNQDEGFKIKLDLENFLYSSEDERKRWQDEFIGGTKYNEVTILLKDFEFTTEFLSLSNDSIDMSIDYGNSVFSCSKYLLFKENTFKEEHSSCSDDLFK
jgi:hypothetical protein